MVPGSLIRGLTSRSGTGGPLRQIFKDGRTGHFFLDDSSRMNQLYIGHFHIGHFIKFWPISRGDTMILVKDFSTSILLKSAPTCPKGWTVYRKNKNNFVECFKMGGNHQKCRKFSRLNRFLKIVESVDQYLMHVNYSYFRIFSSFFDFLIDSQPLPFFRLMILIDMYRAYKISTISDVRHDEAYF